MILKPSKDIGPAWLRMSLDQDRLWFDSYHLLLAAAATTFVFLSWWALTRFFSSPVARAVYGAWVVLQLLVLVVGFAFIMGVGSTFRPYPVVAFSNMEQLCGKHAVPVLIGSDDKLYAFLLILNVGAQSDASDPGKTILYLPRTEVKWLTVLRQEPLHLVARYHELHSLVPDTPTNPEPVGRGDASRKGSFSSSSEARSAQLTVLPHIFAVLTISSPAFRRGSRAPFFICRLDLQAGAVVDEAAPISPCKNLLRRTVGRCGRLRRCRRSPCRCLG